MLLLERRPENIELDRGRKNVELKKKRGKGGRISVNFEE